MRKLEYIVDFTQSGSKDYEKNDKNIVQVNVKLSDGTIVSGREVTVLLNLTKDAMLGLGTELIKKAILSDDDKILCRELFPISKNHVVENLGVYLHPESTSIIVAESDFDTVESYSQEQNK